MTAGTVLATYAVLPVAVICLALAGYWMLLKTVPGFLRVITGGR
jgi:hypothetical protein